MALTRPTTLPNSALPLPATPVFVPLSLYSTLVASGAMDVMLVVWRAALRQASVSGPMPSVML
jgi:hypothetical protein